MRILVIEDEPKVAAALAEGLKGSGYEAVIARTGEDGFFLLETQPFDLAILDLQLPGRDGMELLAALRKQGSGIPVIIVTARDGVSDRIEGLNTGADDYLVKPFALAELLARVRAVLRRGARETIVMLSVDDLRIDLVTREVTRGGEPLHLTAREFDLLEYLVRNQNYNVSREMVAREVWKEPRRIGTLDNVIDVHIARLRKKVDEPFKTRLIHTVRGVGYIVRGASE